MATSRNIVNVFGLTFLFAFLHFHISSKNVCVLGNQAKCLTKNLNMYSAPFNLKPQIVFVYRSGLKSTVQCNFRP